MWNEARSFAVGNPHGLVVGAVGHPSVYVAMSGVEPGGSVFVLLEDGRGGGGCFDRLGGLRDVLVLLGWA